MTYNSLMKLSGIFIRVPTRPGKLGKMIVYSENLEISWNLKNVIKIMEKLYETWKNCVGNKNSPLTSRFGGPSVHD